MIDINIKKRGRSCSRIDRLKQDFAPEGIIMMEVKPPSFTPIKHPAYPATRKSTDF
jgi:hypothetical protein